MGKVKAPNPHPITILASLPLPYPIIEGDRSGIRFVHSLRLNLKTSLNPDATANCIVKQLRSRKLDPVACSYKLIAYGPIFSEQQNMDNHKIYRDKVAALEAELAYEIKGLGYAVIGKHPKRKPVDGSLFSEAWSRFKKEL